MICAIVLAAGRSRRMGRQKLLLPYGGRTVIGHVVDQVRGGPVDRTLIVAGADHDGVAAALAGREVSLVRNPDPEAEMLSSVRCGLRAVPRDCEAVLVALGDQPSLTSELVRVLIEAYRDSRRLIVVPVHGGRRGHPLLFSMRFAQEIQSRYDDVGLRGLLAEHSDDLLEVEAESEAVLMDVDTPEDYRRALGQSG
jgi:molybdenum cofactor cytidylyltransferase